jgi:hypothetical protein
MHEAEAMLNIEIAQQCEMQGPTAIVQDIPLYEEVNSVIAQSNEFY